MTSPAMVGELLDGKWKLKSQLGTGGMGTVFLATDVSLDREVAVKFLSSRLLDDAPSVARFEREAKVMARLDHANLVPIHAFGRQGGSPYLVMKYVPGEPLSVRAAAGLKVAEIVDVIGQLCDGLSHLHQNGILHRDIKPSNLIVDERGRVTLLDFGVARPLVAAPMTPSGAAVGTPRYMAPEQVLGKECDHRIDLYAVGVLLFELSTGSGPFPGKGDVELLRAHVESPAPNARSLNPALSEAMAAVIARALAKSPAERFQSADELKAALAAASGGLAAAAPVRPAEPLRERMTEVLAPPSRAAPFIAVALAAAAFIAVALWLWR